MRTVISETPVLAIRDLALSVPGQALFEGFSLTLQAGERATLTGPSGCGKSSLLRCILGFLRPDGGEVRVLGTALDPEGVWWCRSRTAYVPQEPELGQGSVKDVLARPLSYRANAHLADKPAPTRELFDRFRLPWPLRDKLVRDLSGGEKQRVALVMALLLQRPLLLLDEASSALDREAREAVTEYVAALPDVAVLAVAHDPTGFWFPDRLFRLGQRREEV